MTQADDILELIAGDDHEVAIDPPGDGVGFWAGGPSAVWHGHRSTWPTGCAAR